MRTTTGPKPTGNQGLAPSSRGKAVVGMMSGTSADGIDAVVVRVAGSSQRLKVELLAHRQFPFSAQLRQRVLQVSERGLVSEICELNFELGERFARAALGVIKSARLKPEDILVIGSHGQTIHHLPRSKFPSTLQIGEPAVIAERTGITTIADFRVSDMAAGGQGAPLVPYVDWALYRHQTRPRILQNLGGIGNLTFLPANAGLDQVVAFDTGPGNMVIDAVVSRLSSGRLKYDRNGAWASQGRVSDPLLNQLLAHPFLKRKPPKTTGREEFGERFVADLFKAAHKLRLPDADLVATATAFTSESVAGCYEGFIFPKLSPEARARTEVILSGGGARNLILKRYLTERISPVKVLTQADLGASDVAKEAIAFAVLAFETQRGRPSNVPRATGARKPMVLGKIVLQEKTRLA